MVLHRTALTRVDKVQDEEDAAVRRRLRVLVEIAVAIGRREGLFGKASDTRGNTARDDRKANAEGGNAMPIKGVSNIRRLPRPGNQR